MEHLKKCSIIFNVSSMNWKSLAEGENNFILSLIKNANSMFTHTNGIFRPSKRHL